MGARHPNAIGSVSMGLHGHSVSTGQPPVSFTRLQGSSRSFCSVSSSSISLVMMSFPSVVHGSGYGGK